MSRRNETLWVAVAVCAALLVAARPGLAQSGPADTLIDGASEKERTALYRDGVAAAEAGRWGEALEKFQRVVALRSAPRALLALAAAEEHVGRLVGAQRTYLEARDDARSQGDDALASKAETSLSALAPRIPKLALSLPADVAGAEARLDGALIEISAGGIDVDPGVYRLAVTAPGRKTFEERIAIAAGERKDVAVTLALPGAPEPALSLVGRRSEEPPARTGPPRATWILGAAGLAAVAAGLVIRLTAQSVYDDAKLAEQLDRGNDARGRIIVGTIVASAGAALVGAGALWWALAPSPATSATTLVVGGRF